MDLVVLDPVDEDLGQNPSESYDLLPPSARSRVSFDEVVERQYAAANVVWAEEVSDSGVGLSS